jgi:tetratricopeptide (TPR) repeat protein
MTFLVAVSYNQPLQVTQMPSPVLESAFRRVIPAKECCRKARAIFLFLLSPGLVSSPRLAVGQSPTNREQPTAEYEETWRMVRRGDCQGALHRLQSLTERTPSFYKAFNLMGVCYDRLGDHPKAAQAFLQALKIESRFEDAHVNLGANYVTQGRALDGMAEFKKAIELNPGSVSAFYDLGYTELEQGDPKGALEPLQKAHRLAPQEMTIVLALMRASLGIGRVEEALDYANEISRHQPADPKMEMQVGLDLLSSKQWNAAKTHLSAAAKLDPDLRSKLLGSGEQAFDDGKYEEALCLLNAVRGYLPASAMRCSMAGACYYHIQNPALAVEEVQQAIRLDPQNEQYYIQLAQVFLDYDTPAPAVLLLQSATTRFPSSEQIRFVLGVAYMKSSQFTEARKCLEEIQTTRPGDPLLLDALAVVYEGTDDWNLLVKLGESMKIVEGQQYKGDYYQAEAYFNLFRGQNDHYPRIMELLKESLSLEPNFPQSRFLMGRLLIELGSYGEATESLNRAIALDPNLAGAYYSLSISYARLGERQKSSEALDKFRRISEQIKASEKSLQYDTVDGMRSRTQ